MILHIAPDYFNATLYPRLVEAQQTHYSALGYFVYACDNAPHDANTIPDYVYSVNHSFSTLDRFLFFPKQNYLLNDIEQHVQIADVQLIHAHTLFSSGYLAYQIYKKYGIPYIVAVRNTDVNVFFKHMPHLRAIGRQIAEYARKIIFISPAYQKQVIGKYLPAQMENKTIVIPNGIDDLFLRNLSSHPASKETIRLIYVGSIEKLKNIHTIIRVAQYLNEQGHNVKLCLVGSILEPRYKQLIEANSELIEWHNQCPPDQVIALLRANDIFIMPSYKETFGLVYVEAMSQGLPLIYTRGQGFDGFFEEGKVGYAVPAEDVRYIADRIMDIRKHYDEMSQQCLENVQQFNWPSISASYNHIYQSILTKNK